MSWIAQHGSAPDGRSSVLTDGECSCTYAELPALFAALDDQLRRKGVEPHDALGFECDNSLASAVLLLFLLDRGRHFLLVPKSGEPDPTEGANPPSFCRHRVRAGARLRDPVAITPNGSYRTEPRPEPEATVYLRTSGSTAVPKVAAHTHRGLIGNSLNCIGRFELEVADRVAIPVPLSHLYGLGGAFLPSVAVGASVDLQKGANLIGYLDRERTFEPTVAFLTPSFCDSLVKGRKQPREYRLTVTAGDRLRGDTFERYTAGYGPLVQLYGSTEMGAIAAASPRDPSELRSTTVGTPLPDVEVQLRPTGSDEEGELNGRGAGPSGVGELWCRHAYGFAGYADEAGRLIEDGRTGPDGWFCMHDLGEIGQDGRLRVLGRSDHSVNRSGLLVLFADVEAALSAIPGVDKAVIVSSGESVYGAGMAAFCLPASDADCSEEGIRSACRARMAPREIPDSIVVVSEMPLLASGKVDRRAITEMAHQQLEAAAAAEAGRT